MRTVRVKRWCKEALYDDELTTAEIKEFINERCTHGTTTHGLANVLGRDKSTFKKVGMDVNTDGMDPYKVTVWTLTDDARELIRERKIEKEKQKKEKRKKSKR